uniref:Peptidase M13 C-terminal domain-containing protein n=1 Tax=viral metagenome TaxID=1070528 RepID=A0A6C0JY28_9ZZZZ
MNTRRKKKIYLKQTKKKRLFDNVFDSNTHTHHHWTNVENELIHNLKSLHTSSKYRLEDDFYSYINDKRLKSANLFLKKEKPYVTDMDDFKIVQTNVYYDLIDIVHEYIRQPNTKKHQAVKNVYMSLTNLNDSSAEQSVREYVTLIEERISTGNLYQVIGKQNKNEIISWGCPLVWDVRPDDKNVTKFHSVLSSPKLSLYDLTIYIDDPADKTHERTRKQNIKRKYLQFIETMFTECLGKSHNLDPMDVWKCESQIIQVYSDNSIKEDKDGYNILTHTQGLTYGFNWNEMAKQIGYTNVPKTFHCYSLNYLNGIMKVLNTDNAWRNQQWKTYYLYIAFRQMMRFHTKWRFIYYNFFEKDIQGQPSVIPDLIYPVVGLGYCFNSLLSNKYIEQYKNQEYNDYTQTLSKRLIHVFKMILKRNTWLSSTTKANALNKLDKIKFLIGTPPVLKEDPILSYNAKEAYQNLRKYAYWRTKWIISLDGSSTKDVDIPTIDWEIFKFTGKQSYIVNAFYTPNENSICIPQAYIQKPFIDLEERGVEYNLAYIGYTLAHEMSHCLDDSGSRYNALGNLQDWWTSNDRKHYQSKMNNVIKQYESFALIDGSIFDASLSIGEDIADISGLRICEEYLKQFQDYNKDITIIRDLSFKAFFIYIALQGSQTTIRKSLQYKFITNPHPLEKYRVNCALSRLKLFNYIYNIKKGDKMYWSQNSAIW